jgi:hypothetical protein
MKVSQLCFQPCLTFIKKIKNPKITIVITAITVHKNKFNNFNGD